MRKVYQQEQYRRYIKARQKAEEEKAALRELCYHGNDPENTNVPLGPSGELTDELEPSLIGCEACTR